jgi:hypothetical protein
MAGSAVSFALTKVACGLTAPSMSESVLVRRMITGRAEAN